MIKLAIAAFIKDCTETANRICQANDAKPYAVVPLYSGIHPP